MSAQKQMETLEAFDGIELYCETYVSPSPKGVIIALHDYAEHCGLYDPVFERLARDGFHVYAMDLRGHGRSPGDRAYIEAFDHYLDDLDILWARIRDREPLLQRQIFLLGQGLGATIAARFALSRKPRLCGLILCGPLLDLPLSPLARKLAKLSGNWFPHAAFAEATLDSWLKPRLEPIAPGDQLTFRGPMRLNTVREILGACSELRSGSVHMPFPLLTLLGRGCDSRLSQLAEDVQESVLCADKTLLTYENMGQNILLHRERDQVVGDVIEWCERQKDATPLDEQPDDDEDEDDSL